MTGHIVQNDAKTNYKNRAVYLNQIFIRFFIGYPAKRVNQGYRCK